MNHYEGLDRTFLLPAVFLVSKLLREMDEDVGSTGVDRLCR